MRAGLNIYIFQTMSAVSPDEYARTALRTAVAQVAQQFRFRRIDARALEVLTDITSSCESRAYVPRDAPKKNHNNNNTLTSTHPPNTQISTRLDGARALTPSSRTGASTFFTLGGPAARSHRLTAPRSTDANYFDVSEALWALGAEREPLGAFAACAAELPFAHAAARFPLARRARVSLFFCFLFLFLFVSVFF